jgi:hypothetical protein
MAIFLSFDPWGLKMWAGTGCGGFEQAWAAILGPSQVSLGGTTALAEAVGARPIVDAVPAAASAVIRHRRMLCRVLTTAPLQRTRQPSVAARQKSLPDVRVRLLDTHCGRGHRCRWSRQGHRRCTDRSPCRRGPRARVPDGDQGQFQSQECPMPQSLPRRSRPAGEPAWR